jgi:hypothetical protein
VMSREVPVVEAEAATDLTTDRQAVTRDLDEGGGDDRTVDAERDPQQGSARAKARCDAGLRVRT